MMTTKGQRHPLEGLLLVGARTIHQNLLEPRCLASNLLCFSGALFGATGLSGHDRVVWKSSTPFHPLVYHHFPREVVKTWGVNGYAWLRPHFQRHL